MRRSVEAVANYAGQLLMVAVGAYLGLQAEQWREDRGKAALARAALRNFRDEIAANRAAIAPKLAYHEVMVPRLDSILLRHAGDPGPLPMGTFAREAHPNGTQPFDPQNTAYDLAVATQALGEVPPPLAIRLARLYTAQRAVQASASQLDQGVLGALPGLRGDASRLLLVMDDGLKGMRTRERALVKQYDAMLAPLDSALARR